MICPVGYYIECPYFCPGYDSRETCAYVNNHCYKEIDL